MSGLQLLAPLGLTALISVPLVILFHMRHTTPTIRPVPTLRFWRMAMEEQHEKERFRRPPWSVLLLLQLLIVGLLAFALSRPTASQALGGLGSRTEPGHLILLLDGSTSMSAIDTASGQTRYEVGRERAVAHIADLRNGDVATVLLLGTHPLTFEATDAAGFRALRERLATLPIPGGRVDLNESLRLTHDLLLPKMDDQIVLISDGDATVDPSIVDSLGASVEFEQIGDPDTANVAVVDLITRGSVVSPGRRQLYARVVNFSAVEATVPISITAEGIEVATSSLTIAPGGSREVVQDLPAGAQGVTLTVDAHDALEADNSASALFVRGSDFGLRILLVSDNPSALLRALTVLPEAQVTTLTANEAAIPGKLNGFDLVVYEGSAPPTSLVETPVLFVNPPENGLLPTRGVMSNTDIVTIHPQDPLLAGVELAGVTFGQTPVHTLDATESEIVGAEAGPLIYRGTVPETGQSMVVLAFDISQSNLPKRVAFPILIANIADELAPSSLPSAAALGDPLVYRPHAGAVSVRITPPDGEPVTIAIGASVAAGATDASNGTLRDVAYSDTGRPGVYQVEELADDGAVIGGGSFVINAGHERESDLRADAQLATALKLAQPGASSDGGSVQRDLWPPLAFFAFLFLLIELVVALAPWRSRRRAPRPLSVMR